MNNIDILEKKLGIALGALDEIIETEKKATPVSVTPSNPLSHSHELLASKALKEIDDLDVTAKNCEHGKPKNNYCLPCERINSA